MKPDFITRRVRRSAHIGRLHSSSISARRREDGRRLWAFPLPLNAPLVATQTAHPILSGGGKGQTEQAAISRALGLSQQFGGKITAQCQDKEESTWGQTNGNILHPGHRLSDPSKTAHLEYSGWNWSAHALDDQVVVALRWDSTPCPVQLAQASGLPRARRYHCTGLCPIWLPQGSDLTFPLTRDGGNFPHFLSVRKALWQSLDWDRQWQPDFFRIPGGQPAQEVVEDGDSPRANTEPPEYLSAVQCVRRWPGIPLYSDKPQRALSN